MYVSLYISLFVNKGCGFPLMYMAMEERDTFSVRSPLPLKSRYQKRVTGYTLCTHSRSILHMTKACAGNSFVPDCTGPGIGVPASIASFVRTFELSPAFRTGLQYHICQRNEQRAETQYAVRVFGDFRTEIALLLSAEIETLKIVAETQAGTNNLQQSATYGISPPISNAASSRWRGRV